MGSKSDVSAFFRLRFRNGLGTKPAGALPFRMRSRRSFLRLCLVAEVSLCLVAEVSQWLGHALFLVGSKNNVSALFWLRFRMMWALYFFLFWALYFTSFFLVGSKSDVSVSQWLGHKTCWGSAFSHARPKHLFLEFGLVACRLFLCF